MTLGKLNEILAAHKLWLNKAGGGSEMSSEIALRPSYWASVSGGKDSLYMLNYILHSRPFSVISSNPKYNADYLENIIKTKWLKKLNKIEVAQCPNCGAKMDGADAHGLSIAEAAERNSEVR